jgi:hypothetical protein
VTTRIIVIVIVVLLALSAVMARFGRRSGVSRADMLRKLPGDDIIRDAGYIADRATLLPAPVEEVWPWLLQLGKNRAGWYAPRWLERIIVRKPSKRASHTIIAKYQKLKTGDIAPDWGPGFLKVAKLKAPHNLVYVSVRNADQKGDYLFSWAHILEPVDDTSCRLYTRLRMRRPRHGISRLALLFVPLGGFIDYLTIIVMYAGLRERLDEQSR